MTSNKRTITARSQWACYICTIAKIVTPEGNRKLLLANFGNVFVVLCNKCNKSLSVWSLGKPRLQAVPFWIVERSREIAEREKTGANERRGLGPRLFLLAPVSLRCERTLSTNQKGIACSLRKTTKMRLLSGKHWNSRQSKLTVSLVTSHFKSI